jgi:hypothetical protein
MLHHVYRAAHVQSPGATTRLASVQMCAGTAHVIAILMFVVHIHKMGKPRPRMRVQLVKANRQWHTTGLLAVAVLLVVPCFDVSARLGAAASGGGLPPAPFEYTGGTNNNITSTVP